jgi:hypothetical protein
MILISSNDRVQVIELQRAIVYVKKKIKLQKEN